METETIKKGFHFQESNHSYTFDGKKLTGVTSVLGKVLAKPALIPWASKMACEYIKEHGNKVYYESDLLHYEVTEKQLDEARTAHAQKRDNAADFGKLQHSIIEGYVNNCLENKGKPIIQETGSKHLKTFMDWAFANDITFIATEAMFWSDHLWLAGTADLVFEKDGKRCIGDVKIKKKIYGKEPFLQMAAYHMLSESMENPKGEWSLVLRIDPETAELEELWSKNVTEDREAFLQVLAIYRYLDAGKKYGKTNH